MQEENVIVEKRKLPDIQNTKDLRGININKTGVTKFKLPIIFEGKEVVATVSAYVGLPHVLRGANFSRFLQVCTENLSNQVITPELLRMTLSELKNRMQSEDAYIDLEFEILLEREAPVSKHVGYNSYNLGFIGLLKKGESVIVRRFEVLGSSYCPCSKEMCLTDAEKDVGKGAHNQRVIMRVDLQFKNGFKTDTDKIIKDIENCCSVPLYPILKREDEQWSTITGYSKPLFVEDIARDIVLYIKRLNAQIDNQIQSYSVKVTALESIHMHDAVAHINSENWKLH